MHGLALRKHVLNEEIDYLSLKSLLTDYAHPRDKITALLKANVLIRVKKGLYVFGKDFAEKPYSKETLANLIYGPSAISLEYALAFYGLIPERVNTITSITNKRNKIFATPVGRFTYQYLQTVKYSIGIDLVALDDTHTIFIATPEKALADKIYFDAPDWQTQKDLKSYLFDNLRLEPQIINKLNRKLLKQIAVCYQTKNLTLFSDYLQKSRKK